MKKIKTLSGAIDQYLICFLCTLTTSVQHFMLFSERDHVRVHVRYMLSPVRMSVVCLSSVCDARAPYSDSCKFRQFFYGIWYLGYSLICTEKFMEIVPVELLRRGS